MAAFAVKDERNLSLIQRFDPSAKTIIGYASHVVVYIFNTEQECWERENVEGTLFVVQRKVQPVLRLLVINRLSPTNLILSIDDNLEFEMSESYILFRSAEGMRGIWFAKSEERVEIHNVFEQIVSTKEKLHQSDGPVEQNDSALLPDPTKLCEPAVKPEESLTLTKRQLQEVLLRLVKNDRFVDLLHNEYLSMQKKRQTQERM